MKKTFERDTKLVLQNGYIFSGFSFGARGQAIGEIVFNTGMTGYQEVMTDPSYYGQILTFTYPEIGNTGINYEDSESDENIVNGIIVRNFSNNITNWRSKISLNNWLIEKNVVGLFGVDTRALVKILRKEGSMNGIIAPMDFDNQECFNLLRNQPKMEGSNLVTKVSTIKQYDWDKRSLTTFDQRNKVAKTKNSDLKVVAIDFGIKKSILQRLASYGCEVIVLPYNSTLEEVLSLNPKGIFFSNGPGDPSTVSEGIKLAQQLFQIGNIPMFGICLGHQIFGLALGAKTYKLTFGHRGLNHPCGMSNRIEITSQNHGFALDAESIPSDTAEITHLNLNDKTVAGLKLKGKPIFSVQYHPEAGPGPHDSDYLFGRFVSLMLETC